MNRENFIKSLVNLNASVSEASDYFTCTFDTDDKSTLQLVITIYKDGECSVGVKLIRNLN